MAIKERKVVLTSKDEQGNTCMDLPLTSVDQVEGLDDELNNVVKLTGNQTIAGNKTFTGTTTMQNSTGVAVRKNTSFDALAETLPTVNTTLADTRFLDKNGKYTGRCINQYNKNGYTYHYLYAYNKNQKGGAIGVGICNDDTNKVITYAPTPAAGDNSTNIATTAFVQTALNGKCVPATATPLAAGTAAVGTSAKYAREDHVHPVQTTVSGNAGTATKLATARTIDGMSFNGSANIHHYAECSTAAATAAKAVTLAGFTLATGARIIVRFTVTNTAASPTLNVNGTGAKAIQYRNAAIAAGYLSANRLIEFVYDGSAWEAIGDFDTNSKEINSEGTNYIRFENGVQICFGNVYVSTVGSAPTATYPVPFKDWSTHFVAFAPYNSSGSVVSATKIDKTATGFKVKCSGGGVGIRYIAIGAWK